MEEVTEEGLNAIITQEMQTYHDNADVYNRIQEREQHNKVITAKRNLSAFLASGANNCIGCDQAPTGMKKRDAIYKDDLMQHAPIYAIMCHTCEERALGNSPEHAVENWNKVNTKTE